MIMVSTPEDISMFQMLALKGALKLEVAGMRRSKGPSAYSIVKKQFGFRGNKQKVLDQLVARIEEVLGEQDIP